MKRGASGRSAGRRQTRSHSAIEAHSRNSSLLTHRWREMDSNFRFPDAPSGRSAEARTLSSDREFAPLAWRDRDFEPPAPSRVDLCVRTRTVSGHKQKRKLKSVAPFARNRKFESISLQRRVCVSRDFALPRREAGLFSTLA